MGVLVKKLNQSCRTLRKSRFFSRIQRVLFNPDLDTNKKETQMQYIPQLREPLGLTVSSSKVTSHSRQLQLLVELEDELQNNIFPAGGGGINWEVDRISIILKESFLEYCLVPRTRCV